MKNYKVVMSFINSYIEVKTVFLPTLKKRNGISFKAQLLKYTAALLLCSCLLFLTGINFIIYGGDAKSICIAMEAVEDNASDETSPEKPAEGKSSINSVSIQEEYVHEISCISSLTLVDNPRQYRLLDAAQLAIVHFELLSPPPNV